MKQVKITTEYITLGQLIKFLGLVATGGEVLPFILSADILIEDQLETRRGRKIYPGTVVDIAGEEYQICS